MKQPNILLDDVAGNRDAFVDIRRNYIGASDVPTILGLNPWRTPMDLWMEKTGRREGMEDNDRLWYGRANEPLVARLFERRFGALCTAPNVIYQSAEVPWLTATPDFTYSIHTPDPAVQFDDWGLLECKTPGLHERDKWDESKCPDYVQAQLLTQMFVTGIHRGRAGCIIAGDVDKAHFPEFTFNSMIWDMFMGPLSRFRECVEKDSPPAVKDGDFDNLNELFPPTEAAIDLSDLEIANDLIQEYARCAEALKLVRGEERLASAHAESVKVRLRMLMSVHNRATIGETLLELKTSTRKGYTVEPKSSTTLKIKLPKGTEGFDE